VRLRDGEPSTNPYKRESLVKRGYYVDHGCENILFFGKRGERKVRKKRGASTTRGIIEAKRS